MEVKDKLPLSLELAAKITSLDKIKVIPVYHNISARKTTRALNFFGWRNRLINKMVKSINEDIDISIEKDRNLKFYVYLLGNVYKKNIFIYMDSHYEIK